jgi:transposase
MRNFTRIRQLTSEERTALVKGTKSSAGFTMRRSHILLLSAAGQTPQQIAHQLHCGDQTVRNVIRAFEREGLACLQTKSRRPHHDPSTFDAHGLQRLAELVHRSPRDFGFQTSIWSLTLLARVCFEHGIVARPISYETVRRALLKLDIDWQRARHRITSHDPHYERKKAPTSVDRLGAPAPGRSPAVMGR